jgi:hypothetical protein
MSLNIYGIDEVVQTEPEEGQTKQEDRQAGRENLLNRALHNLSDLLKKQAHHDDNDEDAPSLD